MRITAILLLGCCLQVAAKGTAQSITLSEKNAPLEKVLLSIEKQANVSFYYKVELLQKAGAVTINVKNVSLKQALDICFKDRPFTYEIIGNVIVIKPTARNAIEQIQVMPNLADSTPNKDIRGRVIFTPTEPVPNATVVVKGTTVATYTNRNGEFVLRNVDPKAKLIISSVGIETVETGVNGRTLMVVLAKQKVSDLDQVQIIAYGSTSKRLNTGDVTTVTSEEIAKNPVANVLQALQYRVPGMFIQQQTGVPGGRFNVQIRGQSTFGNQAPLY
ncbi:MAG TPA: carboxypeptidase-like regulatory domain-containing protein, partial [Niastella sp.]